MAGSPNPVARVRVEARAPHPLDEARRLESLAETFRNMGEPRVAKGLYARAEALRTKANHRPPQPYSTPRRDEVPRG